MNADGFVARRRREGGIPMDVSRHRLQQLDASAFIHCLFAFICVLLSDLSLLGMSWT
jgi:hypothetical protein